MTYTPHLVLSQLQTGAVLSEEEEAPEENDPIVRALTFAVDPNDYWPNDSLFISTRSRDEFYLLGAISVVSGYGFLEKALFDATDLTFRAMDFEAQALKFSRDKLKRDLSSVANFLDRGKEVEILDDTLRITSRTLDKPAWAREIEGLGSAQPTAEQLTKIIRMLKGLMQDGHYWEINAAFRSINLKRVSIESMIALLRATYSRRAFLEEWSSLLTSVRKEIIRRGLNSEDVLFGLI